MSWRECDAPRSLQVNRIRWRSSSLMRWATWRRLSLRWSMPPPSPVDCRRHDCSGGHPQVQQQGRLTHAGTIGHAFIVDLQSLPVIAWGLPSSPSSPQKGWFFCGHQQRCRLCLGLVLAPELLLEPFDLSLGPCAEHFQLLLLYQGEHWLLVGILG